MRCLISRFYLKLIPKLCVAASCMALLFASVTSSAEQAATYKIGVLAFRGEDKALKRWSPTADYLNQQIPNTNFVIIPFDLEQLRQAVEKKQVDFVITNTGQYVELEVFYGASRLPLPSKAPRWPQGPRVPPV